MALVLGMEVDNDNEIYLGELRVTVDEIISKSEVKITVHGDYMTEHLVLNNNNFTDIIPKVRMMLGKGEDVAGFCRVMIEAPKQIHILRGKLKKAS